MIDIFCLYFHDFDDFVRRWKYAKWLQGCDRIIRDSLSDFLIRLGAMGTSRDEETYKMYVRVAFLQRNVKLIYMHNTLYTIAKKPGVEISRFPLLPFSSQARAYFSVARQFSFKSFPTENSTISLLCFFLTSVFFLTLRPSILYLLLLSCRILFYYAFFALLYFYSTTFERWGGSLIFRLVESTHFAITFLSALLFVLLAPLRLCGIFALKLRW